MNIEDPVKLAFVLFILDMKSRVQDCKCVKCATVDFIIKNCSCSKGFHKIKLFDDFSAFVKVFHVEKWGQTNFENSDIQLMLLFRCSLCFELEKWLERVDIMWQPCNSIPEASIWFIIDFGKFFCVKNRQDWVECAVPLCMERTTFWGSRDNNAYIYECEYRG